MNKANYVADIIVLMAGEGKRMYPLTKDRPKGLLPCKDGLTIFNHLVKSFSKEFKDICFVPVLGHGRKKVIEEIDLLKDQANFQFISNPFYASAGPVISLWLGLVQSKSNMVVIVNGDTLLRDDCIRNITTWMQNNQEHSTLKMGLCVSKSHAYNKDDMKVQLSSDGELAYIGKGMSPGQSDYKSAGVLCINNKLSKYLLVEKLNDLVMEEKAKDKKYYWHNVIVELKDKLKIDLIEVDNDSWCEVDTNGDLNTLI